VKPEPAPGVIGPQPGDPPGSGSEPAGRRGPGAGAEGDDLAAAPQAATGDPSALGVLQVWSGGCSLPCPALRCPARPA
jgi:hypothetical protein